MPIKLEEMLAKLNLTEDQMKLMGDAQSALDNAYTTELEAQKSGVLSKNQELLDKLKAAKEKEVPEGFDMDGYQDYVTNKDQIAAEQKKLEEDKLIATENWDKLKNDMTNAHEMTLRKETDKLNKQNKLLRNSLDSELIENVALKEIDKVQGSQVLLMPHIKQSIQTYQDESTGRYKPQVVDHTGNIRMNHDTGNPMSVAELVSEFQADEQFAGAFPLQNKGSETTIVVDNGTNYNATNNPFDKSGNHYSLTEQAKLNKSNPTLAKTLREAI